MTTGQTIIDRINSYAGDTNNAIWTAAQKLAAINAAIDAAFPAVKQTKIDSSITLSSTTFEYTPSAADVNLQWGYSVAYVVPISANNEPKVNLKRIKQRLNGTTWTIIVPSDVASMFNGNVLHLQYHAPVAVLSAASDTLSALLTPSYVFNYSMWFLSGSSMLRQPNFNTKGYAEQVNMWYTNQEKELQKSATNTLPGQIAHVADVGANNARTARYGPYLTS